MNVSVSNDALEHYGVRVSSAGATTNYAIFTDEGTSIFNNNQNTVSHFQIKGGSVSGLFYANASTDNVGIGTSIPVRRLHVRGDYSFYHDPNVELGVSDPEGYGDIVYFGGSGSSFNAGDVVYLNSNGDWLQADATTATTSTSMLAIALGGVPSDGMLVRGYVFSSGFGFTIGVPLYLRTAAGSITEVAPGATGNVVRIVGYATGDVGSGNKIYFNPDNTWVEI